jgi:hypothetical protein
VTGETKDVDISGLGLRFEGLTRALAAELEKQWPAYVSKAGGSPALVIRVEDADRTMTPSRFMEGALQIVAAADTVHFRGDEGDLAHHVTEARAVARLAQGDAGRRFWGLVNLTCAAVGWRLLARGGGAVHAAGVLIGDRAYLLVGPSGCGKTTWARTAAEAGCPVLSDDCVLVDSAEGRLVALGSPFRAKDFPSPGPGRWPVAAILIPRHAEEAALEPVPRLMVEARIAANLLFSAAAWEAQPDAAHATGAIAAGAPARILSFRPDASWIELVATIDDSAGPSR